MSCGNCGCDLVMKAQWQVQWTSHLEEVYEERCPICKSLLYGYSKPARRGIFNQISTGKR
jgi:hypothetical protein